MSACRKLPLLVCCLPLLMGAEVYRWVDENGVVNYTQLAPVGVKAEQITMRESGVRAAPQPVTPAAERSDLSPEQQAMMDDLRAVESQRQEEVAKIREANCAQSRDLLSTLTENARIRIREEDGSERVLGEDERQQRIAETQEDVVRFCTSA